MANPFKVVDKVTLNVDWLLDKLAGNPTQLTLFGLDGTTGGLSDTPLATIASHFRRLPVNIFGGQVWEFRIAEDTLDPAHFERVIAVEYGGQLYSVPDKYAPEGANRYWRLRTRPTEVA